MIEIFSDTYNNLPSKTQSIYHFIVKYCTDEIKQYFFHDSDTFLIDSIEDLVSKNVNRRQFEPQQLQKMVNQMPDKDDPFGGCFHEKMSEGEN